MKIFSLDPAWTLPAILASVFLSAAAYAEVPLSWDSTGHIMAPVFVNGKGPFEFILDTGADESAVYAWFAQSLDLPKGARGEISGATGSEPMTSRCPERHRLEDRSSGYRAAVAAVGGTSLHLTISCDPTSLVTSSRWGWPTKTPMPTVPFT
jgi:hypothetical protein